MSPNNARLWAEWGALHLDLLNNEDRAFELLDKSLEIDPKYDWAYSLLGNFYLNKAKQTEDVLERESAYQNSINNFRKALDHSKRINYSFVIATIYQSRNDLEGLINVLEESFSYAKNNDDLLIIEENLAMAYFQAGKKEIAILHAKNALEIAPDSALDRINELIYQIENSP